VSNDVFSLSTYFCCACAISAAPSTRATPATHLQVLRLIFATAACATTMMTAALHVFAICAQAPDDEPVWRQLLQHHINHSNPAVAQQAAAALASQTL
jgi:hypothetical protein